MKFRSTIRIERSYWEWVKLIYPLYGAKSLSAFIEGLLFFFCYGENPQGINIKKLLSDALDGKVFVDNPVVLQLESRKKKFLQFVSESGFERNLLDNLIIDGESFLQTNETLVIQLHHEYKEWTDDVLTDTELAELISLWCEIVKSNGKYRAAVAQYNSQRYARYKANQAKAEMEDY